MHEWDIRSRLKPEAPLSPAGFQVIMELISAAATTGFLRWAFRPLASKGAAVRYRFEVKGAVPSRIDIVIQGKQACLEEAGTSPAQVTFYGDTATYVLVMYGRLSLKDALATGRMAAEGDQTLAMAFNQLFKGI